MSRTTFGFSTMPIKQCPITFCSYHNLSDPIPLPEGIAEDLKNIDFFTLQKPVFEYNISPDVLSLLTGMCKAVYGSDLVAVHQLALKSGRVSFFSYVLNSQLSRSERGMCVAAHWVPENDLDTISTCSARPRKIFLAKIS